MEGYLQVPPERGTIIGRALWKTRYVVLGPRMSLERGIQSSSSTRVSSSHKGLKPVLSKPSLHSEHSLVDSSPWLTIYKNKDDLEIVSQHSMLLMRACEIQSFQHRKGGPTLPTLVISFYPDPTSEKLRKRRSSRTGGLGGGGSLGAVMGETLHFRGHKVPEESYNIYDWQIVLQRQMVALRESTPDTPLSPISPVEPAVPFINPFQNAAPAPRPPTAPHAGSIRRPDLIPRAASTNMSQETFFNGRRTMYATDHTMISPSPSLKSRRSDLSSQASSQQPPSAGYGNVVGFPALPNDLPSPVPTIGTDLIEGWTAAQGRSSALSNHTRASNSVSTTFNSASPFGTTPPAPKESILDRAFQMRYIPGGDKYPEEDEGGEDAAAGRISSIAKFEALMREAEEKKARMSMVPPRGNQSSRHAAVKEKIAGWDVAEEGSDLEAELESEDESDYEPERLDPLTLSMHEISTPAQRALEFISGRTSPSSFSRNGPSSPMRRGPVPNAAKAQANIATGLHQRAHARSLSSMSSRPQSLVLPPSRPLASGGEETNHIALQRQNSTGMKRLSFNEFARRLSSTSSLLLVQTNNSSSSTSRHSRGNSLNGGRPSSELSFSGETEDLHKGGLRQSTGLNLAINSDREWDLEKERELQMKRCGWRGSVGVFGGEGGFL